MNPCEQLEQKTLDEKGFVFLDQARRPYKCAMYHGEPWLFYWHKHQNSWVTYRKVSQTEIWQMPRNLTEEEQGIYHDLHEQFVNLLEKAGT